MEETEREESEIGIAGQETEREEREIGMALAMHSQP
jgi:hypothetical protein